VKSFSTTLASGILLALLVAAPAFAQYGGSGSSTPSYGSGKKVAAGVGAAAAGAGVLYLTLHHRGSLTGCVQNSDSDAPLTLVDDKNHQTYSLQPGNADLRPGQRVQLQGKRSKDRKGAQIFQVSKVAKNLGECGTGMHSMSSSMQSNPMQSH
jgi:hypothetical protein